MNEQHITNYIKNIDFTDKKLSVKQIENDLQILLKEKPSVRFEWTADVKLNEDTGKSERLERIHQVIIGYSGLDANGNTIGKKLKFLI